MIKPSWIFAVVLLCSCSNDRPASSGQERAAAAQAESDAAAVATGSAAAARASAGRSFAGAPDLGSLVHYPAAPVTRRSGAYTWHAAALSERHALRSIVTGELKFTAPDGTPITLTYDRHVEHPDGNWSWIGRGVGEQIESTVITFGDTAVFGTVPQRNGQPPLRLTSVAGRAWVVATDPRLLGSNHAAATQPRKPDFLIPPKRPAAATATTARHSMAAQAISPTAGTKTVVDVLAGYTPGLAGRRGGATAAITRIHNLVDITNQAYLNSQVNAEVRLVYTMLVDYPDATDNGEALEKMTDADPAFTALRAAREQYGADLVVLVRTFQEPENGSCGIAWLIGGDMSAIVSEDEAYGYSVVSDGADGGSNCRDESFAHELGHNMGSHHDSVTAQHDDGVQTYGAYSYSFGKKTPISGGNFYTVMAYGDEGQTPYRVFSNPSVTICGGFPCGSLNQADNARSLNQVIPLIAAFRGPAVPVATAAVENDFDGDGVSDILWRNLSTGSNTIWLAANSATTRTMTRISNLAWTIVGTGDFNGDGDSDVLWRNTSTGANTIWRSGNYADTQAMRTVGSQAWRVVGVGDFGGDGLSDILWRHATTGAGVIWHSGSYANQTGITRISNLAWQVVGVGDFNGDGESDILWRNMVSGANVVWPSASYADQQTLGRVAEQAWTVFGTGDFDADGHSDVLWRNTRTGANTIWRSADIGSQQRMTQITDQAWTMTEVADYDGDGRSDVLWRNTRTGRNTIWLSGNYATSQAVSGVLNQSWQVMGN